ncbi:MAG: hypothetical protein JNM47_01020 [Hyphomonadaceae bacterium]|nr:hypothetical protein [Hyphomonadaceae bacterium]
MAKTRITFEFDIDDDGKPGEFNIYLNPEARDWLVSELLSLDERNDHFHLWSMAWTPDEVGLSQLPYRGKVIDSAKILFRTDAWDEEHFPHVMQPQPTLDDFNEGPEPSKQKD